MPLLRLCCCFFAAAVAPHLLLSLCVDSLCVGLGGRSSVFVCSRSLRSTGGGRASALDHTHPTLSYLQPTRTPALALSRVRVLSCPNRTRRPPCPRFVPVVRAPVLSCCNMGDSACQTCQENPPSKTSPYCTRCLTRRRKQKYRLTPKGQESRKKEYRNRYQKLRGRSGSSSSSSSSSHGGGSVVVDSAGTVPSSTVVSGATASGAQLQHGAFAATLPPLTYAQSPAAAAAAVAAAVQQQQHQHHQQQQQQHQQHQQQQHAVHQLQQAQAAAAAAAAAVAASQQAPPPSQVGDSDGARLSSSLLQLISVADETTAASAATSTVGVGATQTVGVGVVGGGVGMSSGAPPSAPERSLYSADQSSMQASMQAPMQPGMSAPMVVNLVLPSPFERAGVRSPASPNSSSFIDADVKPSLTRLHEAEVHVRSPNDLPTSPSSAYR